LFVSVGSLGTVTRALATVALGIGLITVSARGSVRRPGIIVCLLFAVTVSNVLTLFWTISLDDTLSTIISYLQLFGMSWLVWEIIRLREEPELLMLAYCAGAYVSIVDAILNFMTGVTGFTGRVTGANLNPNEFGALLAIGIPLAWFLFLTKHGLYRFVAAAYLPLAVITILLTASRGAFLAGVVAMSVVPLTISRRSLRAWGVAVLMLLLGAGIGAVIVPQNLWDRILTASAEVDAGTFGGRGVIWAAGFEAFQNRPLLGYGSGAFEPALSTLGVSRTEAPHNVFVAVVVEQGIVGLVILVTLLCACGWLIVGLPPPLRSVWAVASSTWLVGSMSINWQYGKVTWMLFALLAVTSATHSEDLPDIAKHVTMPARPVLAARGREAAAN
jgi:O-antigen ligase